MVGGYIERTISATSSEMSRVLSNVYNDPNGQYSLDDTVDLTDIVRLRKPISIMITVDGASLYMAPIFQIGTLPSLLIPVYELTNLGVPLPEGVSRFDCLFLRFLNSSSGKVLYSGMILGSKQSGTA